MQPVAAKHLDTTVIWMQQLYYRRSSAYLMRKIQSLFFKILVLLGKVFVPGSALIRAPQYNRDGLTTVHNADFMSDPKFSHAYARGKSTASWGSADIHWRIFVACWAAEHAIRLGGDFVECGVNRGGLAMSIIEFTDFTKYRDRRFYLLDTYNGLVDRLLTPVEIASGKRGGGYEECYASVCETFSSIENAILIRGIVPDTLQQVHSDAIAFLSIDMNCEVPEIAAAEYFWGRIQSGGVIVLDDYGWAGHIRQKLAFDKFASERNVRVLSLPTGQGLIFHP